MNNPAHSAENVLFQRNIMTSFVQIAALVILVGYSVQIIGPFTGIVIWGVILGVAIYPVHMKITASLGGAKKSAGAITLLGLALLIGPAWIMAASSIDSIVGFVGDVRAGTLEVPTPSDSVADWPLIGQRVYAAWSSAATDLTKTAAEFEPQIRQFSERMMRSAGSLAIGVLQFAVSIIIAGFAMLYADEGYRLSCAIAKRINAERGHIWADMSIATIRSVTNGVLGVAVIQAVLAGIGFFVIGIPHPGLFAALVLVSAIVQVPALLIMLPIAGWAFSFADTLPATIFAIYSLVVALSDNVLKPILLGRGVDLPALIVLIGAIGGMIRFGVVGLFVGAVILGLSYTIISDWLKHPGDASPSPESGNSE